MTGPGPSTAKTPLGQGLGRVLAEAVAVTAVGIALALLANALSPRGLSLGRDYFPPAPPTLSTPSTPPAPAGEQPTRPVASPVPGATAATATSVATTNGTSGVTSEVRARLAARGLRLIETPEAKQLFDDPRRLAERVVFVDARNEVHFDEGHVPGAYLFDRYYPENHLPTVLPACLGAEQVVVYCLGGECEDSELAGAALLEAGVASDRVGVYAGGMTDWIAAGLPVEVGARNSGQMKGAGR